MQRVCGLRRGIAAARQWAHHGWPLRAIARGAAVRRVRGSRFRSVMRWSLVRPMGMGGKPVIPSAWWPAWYRLGAGLRRDWAGYLAISLIVGLLGGLAMASVAAARRTQSAFPRILAASNASDLDVDPGPYSARVAGQISRLPRVRS